MSSKSAFCGQKPTFFFKNFRERKNHIFKKGLWIKTGLLTMVTKSTQINDIFTSTKARTFLPRTKNSPFYEDRAIFTLSLKF